MADIFISYKRSRRELVATLAKVLEAHGWTVWFDASLTDGERFRAEIERELSLARCVVAIWCDQSIVADFVLDEASWAKAQGALIQARWMEVDPPLGFGQQQQVDLIGWSRGITPKVQGLVNAIERLIGPPNQPIRKAMGRPTNQAHSIAVAGTPMSLTSSPAITLPPHLAIQLEHALRSAVSEYSQLALNGLNARVRLAVEAARRIELAAINTQHMALHSAEQAEEAARRARNGQPGFRAYDVADDAQQRRYEGAWSDDSNNGHGVFTFGAGEYAGDRYLGHFTRGHFAGPGVYAYAARETNSFDSLRYEGEYSASRMNGIGMFYWNDGARNAGSQIDGTRTGPCVYHFASGRRFEGEYARGKRNGFGVVWHANGEVAEQGFWTDGTLTTPMSR